MQRVGCSGLDAAGWIQLAGAWGRTERRSSCALLSEASRRYAPNRGAANRSAGSRIRGPEGVSGNATRWVGTDDIRHRKALVLVVLIRLLGLPFWLPWRLLQLALWHAFPVRVMHLDLSGTLPDFPPAGGFASLLRRSRVATLMGVLRALELACREPALRAVAIRIQDLNCGLARAEEIRQALLRVQAAGKAVAVHAEELGVLGYWIALGAGRVELAPGGGLNVAGIAAEFTLLRGLLDRIGVRAQLEARGRFKSMRETFTESAMSDANREMLEAIVSDLAEQLVEATAHGRKITKQTARELLDTGPHRAPEAKACGLVDGLSYFDEFKARLKEEYPGRRLAASRYLRRRARSRLSFRRPVAVAVIRVTGSIKSGADRQGPSGTRATGSDSLARVVRRAQDNPRIRAVVLRVDSPGGSALASDVMWRELSLLAETKPTFVSMVNTAASGGYYVSGLKGVQIWASPTTLTGSIGVVGGKFVVSELLARVGIAREQVLSGPRAAYHSLTREWSKSDLEKLARDIDASYQEFVSKMADVREVDFAALHEVAQGRVWTGRHAARSVLVDHLGGLHEVERAVRERLELKDARPLAWVCAEPRGAFSGLGGEAQGDWQRRIPDVFDEAWAELWERAEWANERLLLLTPVRLRLTDRT
jgi:protease IV